MAEATKTYHLIGRLTISYASSVRQAVKTKWKEMGPDLSNTIQWSSPIKSRLTWTSIGCGCGTKPRSSLVLKGHQR